VYLSAVDHHERLVRSRLGSLEAIRLVGRNAAHDADYDRVSMQEDPADGHPNSLIRRMLDPSGTAPELATEPAHTACPAAE
jgi:hypothetical protein